MSDDDGQSDIFSAPSDLALAQQLLADLHNDLVGKVARFRQLEDLSGALGSSGTMLFGGETALAAWHEARSSFVHGNFTATVLLCQGLVENLLAAFLRAGLMRASSHRLRRNIEALPRSARYHGNRRAGPEKANGVTKSALSLPEPR